MNYRKKLYPGLWFVVAIKTAIKWFPILQRLQSVSFTFLTFTFLILFCCLLFFLAALFAYKCQNNLYKSDCRNA